MPAGKNHLKPFKFRHGGKKYTFYGHDRDEAREIAKRWLRRRR